MRADGPDISASALPQTESTNGFDESRVSPSTSSQDNLPLRYNGRRQASNAQQRNSDGHLTASSPRSDADSGGRSECFLVENLRNDRTTYELPPFNALTRETRLRRFEGRRDYFLVEDLSWNKSNRREIRSDYYDPASPCGSGEDRSLQSARFGARREVRSEHYPDRSSDKSSGSHRGEIVRTVRHRNLDEALSSLLWQPYECRGSPPHSGPAARDGESCADAMRLAVPAPAPAPASVQTEQCRKITCVSVNEHNSVVSVDGGEVMSACRPPAQGAARQGAQAQLQVQQQQQPQPTPVQLQQNQHLQQSQQQLQQQQPAALLPPPYSTLPPPHAHHAVPLTVQPHSYPFQPISLRRCQYGEDSERPKTCCGGAGARALGLRWFIAIVALAGVCCILVGTVLGAVRAHGKAHLTVLLLMIGVGLVLVTVSGVAWRAAGRRSGSVTGSGNNRSGTSVPRRTALPCARAHHPYAAMLYPEFHCRPPPPSYQASMHEYRLRLLLLDRATSPPPVTCPPPAYRPRRTVNAAPQYPGGRGTRGRRRAEQHPPASPLSAVVIQNIALESYDDIKYDDEPEIESHIVSNCKEEAQQENKEGNLVTIVQTGEDCSPVIVTVSGSIPEERPSQTHTSEIDILAHL